MQHIVNVAFDFDDKKVAQSIEEQVHREVVDNITRNVEEVICKKSYYRCSNEKDFSPLKNMVESNVKAIIEDCREQIIEMAARKLADSLKRTKAVKEAIGQVLDD